MLCILCAGGGIIISLGPNEHFPRLSIGLGSMIPLRLVGVPTTMMLLATAVLLFIGGPEMTAPELISYWILA